MEKRHRIFIAINLPGDIKKQLAKYQDKWPELGGKWTPKDNLHITLEFLGDLTDLELADVCKIAGEVAERHEVFSITLNNNILTWIYITFPIDVKKNFILVSIESKLRST